MVHVPCYWESWDIISIHDPFDLQGIVPFCSIFNPITGVDYFNQNNEHHTDTLGMHMMRTANYLMEHEDEVLRDISAKDFSILYDTAFIHDIGKIKTASFTDSKGNKTKQCHYYRHENVGAYDSIMVECGTDRLKRAQLINCHMMFYNFIQSQKTFDKYQRTMDNNFMTMLYILYKADMSSH